MNDEARATLIDEPAHNATAGDLVHGTGGDRKLRWDFRFGTISNNRYADRGD